MGNSSAKESRNSSSQPSSLRSPNSPPEFTFTSEHQSPAFYSSRNGRSSGQDLSFFGIGGGSERPAPADTGRKETKQEREARKLEKERQARARERERSLKEESVDGGYLVTLGTYTGPEDFSKSIVRQLQIERRLAPFWRGLNDHSTSWVEHQLVAAARALPIPPADQVPPELLSPARTLDLQPDQIFTIPIPEQPQNDHASSYSPSHHAQSSSVGAFPSSSLPSSSQIFRGRAKSLASLASSAKASPQQDIAPQEVQLPKDPYVNGQRLEALLYKDVIECPICFLYYPPYLNKTRCCDQPICSECFVQIKRPDPHPPEHLDPNTPVPEVAIQVAQEEEEGQLVSEPATCPFCVQPEFGVSYQAPPFRKGLAYTNQAAGTTLGRASPGLTSGSSPPMNSSFVSASSAAPLTGRRTESLSANAPTVITTDKVRPDWAKKLSDARSHAARRSAAATALHTAAYMMGGQGSTLGFGRRRRINTDPSEAVDAPDPSERSGSSRARPTDLLPGRTSSRANRHEDLEELMMMEAIRLSLATEEDRKRKEEKEAAKQAKKDDKQRAKEQKKADKAAKKSGLYLTGGSSSSMLSFGGPNSPPADQSQHDEGKGKTRATAISESQRGALGSTPMNDPTSTVNTETSSTLKEDPQKHLEQSRANVLAGSTSNAGSAGSRLRQMSNASSTNSSLAEPGLETSRPGLSAESSFMPSQNASGQHLPPSGGGSESTTPNITESMFNFRSLAEMIDKEGEDSKNGPEHVDHARGEQSGVGSAQQHEAPTLQSSFGQAQPSTASEAPESFVTEKSASKANPFADP